ncbi:MAG: sulfatase-like hydrolase/transferase, partial [Cytophagaceae bacterium]|nr:sulfatase-like hydrolase/transferase [Cytophagaceae bacterium]
MKKLISGRVPHYIVFIFSLYLPGLLFLMIMRMVLIHCATNEHTLFEILTLRSLLIGLQFDTVVLCYILALPAVLLFIQSIVAIKNKTIPYIVTVFLCIVFPLLAFIVVADIPYFIFFKNRLTESALQWMGSIGIVLKMIIGNSTHLTFLIAGLILCIFITYFLYRYCKRSLLKYDWTKQHSNIYYSVSFLIIAALCFLGMRGGLGHPVRQGDAFYCDDPVLNQAGLNPAFTLIKSYEEKVNLMDEELAIKNTQQMLSIGNPIVSISPIAREVKGDANMNKYNIVLVLMEGMSAHNMEIFGNKEKLTPTLDSLAKKSWFFTNAYSAGIHTNNGIFSSLFS